MQCSINDCKKESIFTYECLNCKDQQNKVLFCSSDCLLNHFIKYHKSFLINKIFLQETKVQFIQIITLKITFTIRIFGYYRIKESNK